MIRKKMLLLAALMLAAGPAVAGTGAQLTGQTAPEIQGGTWLNRPELTSVSEYRGKVLLLEFFATW